MPKGSTNSERPSDPLHAIRQLLLRIGDETVRRFVEKTLVLWEFGYLREALSGFRVIAEDALRRIASRRIDDPAPLDELDTALARGRSARAIELLQRDLEVIPARIALQLHTLLAWGNYASHHQREGHHAKASDLAVLLSISVDLEEWVSAACEGRGSIFEQTDAAWELHRAEQLARDSGLGPGVISTFVAEAGIAVSAEPHRLVVEQLALELFWGSPPSAAAREPYRGMQCFEPEDAERFFGRSALLQELEDRVDTRWLTVVCGASGSGKTSLLRAGLIPRLIALDCAVLAISDYGEQTLRVVEQLTAAWPPRPLTLLLDQFERVLLPTLDPQHREGWLQQALCAARDVSGRRVVIGIREDLLGRLYREAQRFDEEGLLARGDALFVVGPLEPSDAREAIVRPLQGTGKTFDDPFLRDQLLPALFETTGTSPTKLQIVCSQLFAQARATGVQVIGAELYAALGGADRLISAYLDEALSSARYSGVRGLARALLKAMAGPAGRRWVDLGEIWHTVSAAFPGTDEVELRSLLERLIADRLVLSRRQQRGENAEYSLTHDQLSAAAQAWISAEELELQLAQEWLDRALAVWTDPHRRELLRGRALRLVEANLSRLRVPDRRVATALLEASQRVRRAARVGTAILLVIAFAGLLFGAVQLRRATRERDRAIHAADRGVLLQARLSLERDPSVAVAWLRNLSQPSSGVGAQTLVAEARRRGIAAVLSGHEQLVTSVAFSPDGRRLVSGSRDRSVRLWSMAARRQQGPALISHAGFVNRVAFSPSGDRVVSAGADGALKIWDPREGRLLATLRQPGGIQALCFAPDDRRIATGSEHGALSVWDLARRDTMWKQEDAHRAAITALAWTRDGSLVVSGSLDGTLRIWDARARAPLGEPLRAHEGGVHTVALSPDGQTVASAGRDALVQLWNVATQKRERTLRGHGDWVLSVAFSPDGKLLASAGVDREIHLWKVEGGQHLPPLKGHVGHVHEVAFSPAGTHLASASLDGTIRIWDLRGRKSSSARIEAHEGRVRAVAFSGDGLLLASAGEDRTVRLWDVSSRRALSEPVVLAEIVRAVAFSPDGRTLAAAGGAGMLQLWRRTASGIEALPPPASAPASSPQMREAPDLHAVAFAPDGRSLVVADSAGGLQLWDVAHRRRRGPRVEAHSAALARRPLYAVAFLPDGTHLASGGGDGKIRIWRIGQPLTLSRVLGEHEKALFAIAISPDGRRLASAGADGSIRVWDLTAQTPRPTVLTGHAHWVLSVAFFPDGRTVASASSDGTVRIWDTEQGQAIGPPFLGHEDWVYAVAVSAKRGIVASGSADRTLWLWQVSPFDLSGLRRYVDSLTNVWVSLEGRVEYR